MPKKIFSNIFALDPYKMIELQDSKLLGVISFLFFVWETWET